MVNDELRRIERALPAAADALAPGGRLAAISFHSLEDRIVKHTFRALASDSSSATGTGSTHRASPPMIESRKTFTVLTRKPVVPGDAEVARNPAARSAKLRVLERVKE